MAATITDVCAALKTSAQTGLASQEAARRLAADGRNELISEEDDPLWKKFAEMFKDPMIALLLCSAFVSVLLGHLDDAISIALAVLIVTVVAFVQEYRSEKAIAALQELVATTCSVKRDGHVATIEAKKLVVGDILVVRTGDRVAADARLTKAVQLEVDASTFTGEAAPCARSVGAIAPNDDGTLPAPVDRTDTILTGTTVRRGHGEAVVVATGMDSAFGDVYKLMQETAPSRSPLQLRMDDLGQLLTKFSFIVIFFIVLFGVVLSKRALFDMFQIAVSLAVAAIPEGLPIVVTVTLALGAHRMAASKAIVKKLPAVESLGCAGVVCADKTGTFTCNEMTLSAAWSLAGAVGERGPTHCAFSGVGFDAEGAVGDGYGAHIAQIVRIGVVCNNAAVAPVRVGQPTEVALMYAAAKAGLGEERELWERRDELAFSSATKWMAVRCEPTQAGLAAGSGASRAAWFVKGALEAVAPFCSHFVARTGSGSDELGLAPFTSRERKLAEETAARMGGEGLRVLALAYGGADATSGAAALRPGAPGCACDFVFAGLVALRDPVRPSVPRAVALLGSSGVDVIMVTGDAKGTALAVAKEVGLYDATEQSAHLAMSGTELDAVDFEHLSTAQLRAKLRPVRVFYRTTPRHKLALVTAFQQLGEVVAMTGDGVNDAPALKKADIGIAMGKSGTDVAREAADIILVDDDFAAIMKAIREGKAIFHNIKNFVRFQLSTSIAALFLIIVATLLDLPNPMNAMQILWINIIMDGPPAQTLGVEPVDADVMRQPPRPKSEAIVTVRLIRHCLIAAAVTVANVLLVFWSEMSDGEVTARDTTMTFTCFVLSDMFNAISCRSADKSLFSIGIFSNKALNVAIGGCLLGQLAMVHFPPLQSIFRTESISLFDWLFLTLLSSNVLVVDEARKMVHRRRHRGGSAAAIRDSAARAAKAGARASAAGDAHDLEAAEWKET